MMEDHENEERELTGGMERALAAAIVERLDEEAQAFLDRA